MAAPHAGGAAGGGGIHHLPTSVVWVTTLVIAFVVALTNFVMVYVDVKLVVWKFDAVQTVMNDHGVELGAFTLAAFGVLYCCVATGLVCLVSPLCAGSGLPEAKGYLNGSSIPGMFDFRSFGVRVLGIIFSTSAGFPAGREGPMVCIGGFIGYQVVDCLSRITFLRKWCNLDIPHPDVEWFANSRRIGATLGGAAGVATAFSAPLGGILYMLEEATVTSWAPETTFRALVCTACGVLISRGLLNASNADFNRLVIFEDNDAAKKISWDWIDVPFFVLLAALVGLCAAGFTKVLILVWSTRRNFHKKLARFQPMPKMLECIVYVVFCNFIFSIVPLGFDCVREHVSSHSSSSSSSASHGGRRLGGGANLVYVQYDCPSHHYNGLASLLLNGGEAAVKHLVSRNDVFFGCDTLFVGVLVYGILAMGMPGLAVPMGNFIPSMVIGSLIGRFVGEALDGNSTLHGHVAKAGVYAMVGSASMLGGFTHMTIAIVALLTEAGHDLSLIPPLMLGIFVAHFFSKLGLGHHGYDEILILLKGVPFLEQEVPEELYHADTTAKTICKQLPEEALLQAEASLEQLKTAVQSCSDLTDIPVIDDGVCLGLAPMRELAKISEIATSKEQPLDKKMSLRELVDPHRFRLLEGTLAAKFYHLYAKGVARNAYVISKKGEFRGTLSRCDLIAAIDAKHSAHKHSIGGEMMFKQVSVGSVMSVVEEYGAPHEFPVWLVWAITIITACCVAITNFCMVWVDVKLVTWKFDATQTVISDHNIGMGCLCLAGFGVLYAMVATNLVCFLAPICAGSGLPEAKGYLNGNHIPRMFEIRAFITRVLGIIFSTAAGFPAGREGPMVCIGGFIGEKVTHVLALPFVRRWVELDTTAGHFSATALQIDEEHFAEAKRLGCALGGAAGVAVAFNAPLGGILYMFEEVTVTSWAPELTFRAVVCTACGAIMSRALLNLTKADFHMLVIYEDDAQAKISWDWIDVPFFLCLAAVVGTCATLFTKALVLVWTIRKRVHIRLKTFQPYAKIAECGIYIIICSVVFALIPLPFDCESTGPATSHRRLGGAAGVSYRQYDCPAKENHNVLASLLLNGGEGAVKHLYSRSASAMPIGPLLVALIAYGILAMGMPGLAVPMGNFIPSMVIGSLIGRILGECLHKTSWDVANSGVYAMVGSAAMLGGFTHMTIAIVALLVEAGHDIYLTPPLMMSVFVAHFFSKIGSHHGYDEVLIIKKGVPFLEPDPPHEVDNPSITPLSLCVKIPDDAHLPYQSTGGAVRLALNHQHIHIFPVFREGYLVGITTAARLRGLVPDGHVAHDGHDEDAYEDENACFLGEEDEELHLTERFSFLLQESDAARDSITSILGKDEVQQFTSDTKISATKLSTTKVAPEPEACVDRDTAEARGSFSSSNGNRASMQTFPLKLIMDPFPFEIVEDMPVTKVYSLFSQGVVTVACVVSKTGDFLGILTRSCFTEQHIAEVLALGPTPSGGLREAAAPATPASPAVPETELVVRPFSPAVAETGFAAEFQQSPASGPSIESVNGATVENSAGHLSNGQRFSSQSSAELQKSPGPSIESVPTLDDRNGAPVDRGADRATNGNLPGQSVD